MNLLSNAVKFTQGGTITVSAWFKEPRIKHRSDLSGSELGNPLDRMGMLYVQVKDSGVGIPEEEIPKLFKDFATLQPASEPQRCWSRTLNLQEDNQLAQRRHHGRIDPQQRVNVHFPRRCRNEHRHSRPLEKRLASRKFIVGILCAFFSTGTPGGLQQSPRQNGSRQETVLDDGRKPDFGYEPNSSWPGTQALGLSAAHARGGRLSF
jgi:hypothetical protein